MVEDGSYSETLGVLIAVGASIAGGIFLSGMASTLLYIVAAGILGLWVLRYIMEGAAETHSES